jgi:hypothetical protein
VEHVASGQAAPERCTVPDPRAVERIGAGGPTPRPHAMTPREPEARPATVGVGGVRRRAGIDTIIGKHAVVRDLVGNGWLNLFRIDPEQPLIEQHRGGQWHRIAQG